MGAVRMRVQTADKNITIIHTTPVHQLMSWEDKSWNKSSIKMFLTSNHCSTVNGAWSAQISLLIQTRWHFHWRKRYYGLWTLARFSDYFSKSNFKDFFLLSSPDVNWWTGVVWIIVMFLSDSHSDGTHSLQSIHCWDTDVETHFYKPDEETNSS